MSASPEFLGADIIDTATDVEQKDIRDAQGVVSVISEGSRPSASRGAFTPLPASYLSRKVSENLRIFDLVGTAAQQNWKIELFELKEIVGNHYHKIQSQVLVVLDGELEVTIDEGKPFRINSSQPATIGPNVLHALKPVGEKGVRFLAIDFPAFEFPKDVYYLDSVASKCYIEFFRIFRHIADAKLIPAMAAEHDDKARISSASFNRETNIAEKIELLSISQRRIESLAIEAKTEADATQVSKLKNLIDSYLQELAAIHEKNDAVALECLKSKACTEELKLKSEDAKIEREARSRAEAAALLASQSGPESSAKAFLIAGSRSRTPTSLPEDRSVSLKEESDYKSNTTNRKMKADRIISSL